MTLLGRIIGDKRQLSTSQLLEIARACSCLPIALRAAGSYLVVNRSCTAREYLDDIQSDRFGSLPGVKRVLALSVDRLEKDNPNAASRFRKLSVFPASFNRAAAASLWQLDLRTARETLDELGGRSLLRSEVDRYSLHDLYRELLREGFSKDLYEQALGSHARFYGEFVANVGKLYSTGQNPDRVRAMVDSEWPNIEYGFLNSVERISHYEEAARTVLKFLDAPSLFLIILPLGKLVKWTGHGLSASQRLKDKRLLAVAHGRHGDALRRAGKAMESLKHTREALRLAAEIGDTSIECKEAGNLGYAFFRLGRYEDSKDCFDRQLTLSESIKDASAERSAQIGLAITHKQRAEFSEAEKWLGLTLASARRDGDEDGETIALGHYGNLCIEQGDAVKSREYFSEALRLARKTRDQQNEAVNLGSIAMLDASEGRHNDAIVALERVLHMLESVGDMRQQAVAAWNLAQLQYYVGQRLLAFDYGKRAFRTYQEIADPRAMEVGAQLRAWGVDPDAV